MVVKTIGDLKKAIAKLPDDTIVGYSDPNYGGIDTSHDGVDVEYDGQRSDNPEIAKNFLITQHYWEDVEDNKIN